MNEELKEIIDYAAEKFDHIVRKLVISMEYIREGLENLELELK